MRQLGLSNGASSIHSATLLRWGFAAWALTLMAGCPGIKSPGVKPDTQEKHAAIGETVVLDLGDAVLPGGDASSYEWVQTAGPAIPLSDPNSRQLTFVPEQPGEYEFTVTIADGQGGARVLIVRVWVIEQLPTSGLQVSAGPDRLVQSGSSVSLSPSVSGGMPPYQYAWTPADGLDRPTNASPIASPSATTVYTLTVTDSSGTTASDSVQVSVAVPEPPGPLEVHVGRDVTTPPGAPTVLCGYVHGGIMPYQYSWTPTDGLSDPTSSCTYASPSVTTVYTLTVTDSVGAIGSASIQITVPVQAEAGPERIIPRGGSAVLAGSATGGSPPYQYAWTPSEGLDNPATAQPIASPSATTVYTLTVTDSAGVAASDNVRVNVGTPVSGPCWSGTTWTAGNSPYILSGDVQVPEGITLTIEPGVEVVYIGSTEIYVRGALIANGSPDAKISFMGSDPAVKSGATFVKFEGANLSASQLSYVVMRNAVQAIRIGEEDEHAQRPKNTGTLTVAHAGLEATEAMTDGYNTDARLVLADCALTSSSVVGEYPLSEPIDIINSTITGCRINSRINSETYNKGITLNGCIVSSTDFFLSCWPSYYECPELTSVLALENSVLSQCLFVDDAATGLLRLARCQCTDVTIYLPNAEAAIADCSFQYTPSYAPVVRNQYGGSYVPPARTTFRGGTIQFSTITGNGAGAAIEARTNTHSSPLLISHCTIQQNETSVLLTRYCSPPGDPTCSITHSNLLSNSHNAIVNQRPAGVLATDNYWGTVDAASIGTLIHDYFDDITFGQVTFTPYAPSPIQDAGPRP